MNPMPTLEAEFGEPSRQHSPEQLVAMVRKVVPLEGIPNFFDHAYTEIVAALSRVHRAPVGPALAVSYSEPTDTIDLGAAFPIDQAISADAGVETVTIPACEVATLTVKGPYEELARGYGFLKEYMVSQGMSPGPLAWEEYLTMPQPGGDPSQNITQLRWMIS